MKSFVMVCCAGSAALAWCGPAWGANGVDDDSTLSDARKPAILVSASRDDDAQFADEYPGSVTIIAPEQIDQRQVRDVAEALRDVPGVAVSAVAGQTQIRLRGSEANHVLVLVDGIEVSDPFAGEFDLSALQTEIGSRIEVLRGPQSALYGSDAIGGVVAYRSSLEPGFAVRIEGGTNDTINGAARFGASGRGWAAALSSVVVSTDGEPNARGGSRAIGRDSITLATNAAFDLTAALTARAVARYVRSSGEFNDQDFDSTSPTFGLVIDSPDTRYENEAIYALVGAELATLDGRWTHDLSLQHADIARDSFGPFGRTFGSEGERLKASYVSALKLASGPFKHAIIVAADWEEERYRNTDPFGFAFTGTRANENTGLAGEYRLAGKGLTATAAVRHDINENFADATTFRLAASYSMTDTTRVRGAIGTGIKNPGFYELFGFVDGRFFGNSTLRPEQSTGWEIGIDQGLFDGALQASLVYFESELEDEIFTAFPPPDFAASPANRNTVSTRRGIELSASARITGTLRLDAAYTYLDAVEDGLAEVRRPQSIASAALAWSAPGDRASAAIVVRHNGDTADLAFTDPSFIPVRVTLENYTLVHLNGRMRLTDRFEVFARAENLLDTAYEQVLSFVSPGRSAVFGIGASF